MVKFFCLGKRRICANKIKTKSKLFNRCFKMKMFLTVCFLLLFNTVNAGIRHFYIEVLGNEVEIGESGVKPTSKRIIGRYKPDSVPQSVLDELLPPGKEEGILYYFHSLYGGVSFYHKTSLRFLSTLDSTHIQKVISIIWHARRISYTSNWQQSVNQGIYIAPLLQKCLLQEAKTNNLLCHSMGHRLMEGFFSASPEPAFKFNTIIFAAADLNTDVFNKNLTCLPAISKQIVVLVNKRDRLLGLSRRALGRDRLGLQGSVTVMSSNVQVQLVSGKFPYDPSNHIYFKSAPKVRRLIRQLL